MTTLIIVESPNKTKKIESYLGSGYKVMASVGHIRDLPDKEMGVEAPSFKPRYVASKRSQPVISKLKKAAQEADQVLLATDPDREGEAIAWHLMDTLKLKSFKRVKFNSITKDAIKQAISNPGEIDMALVAAQEARRVLDRLVGYTVSPLLKTMTGGVTAMSAGRVQTPAVLLVVLADRAIESFKPIDHYKLKAVFPWPGKAGATWTANWQHKPLQKALGLEETEHFTDKAFVSSIAGALLQQNQFIIYKAEGKETARKPPSPFSTSLLQQVANTKLGYGVDTTMEAAQSLFDHGLITYHRTDSLNFEEGAAEEIRQWLHTNGYGVPEERNTWNSKDGAQEAHEAIRPTDITNKQPSEFSSDSNAGKLYKLIWERTVASQMEPATYFATTVILVSALKVQGQNLQFIARGRTLLSQGWLKLTPEQDGEDADGNEIDDAAEEGTNCALPHLEQGLRLNCLKGEPISATTKPPARLTIASLVRELERHGIGRPSTFASIIKIIIDRGYIEVKGKKVYATTLGLKVADILSTKFSFARLDFTRIMEGGLDKIAAGKTSYLTVVKYQYDILTREVEAVNATLNHGSIAAARKEAFGDLAECTACGKGSLVRRKGKSGHFWSCTAYPECTASCKDLPHKGSEPKPDLSTLRTKDVSSPAIESEENCPKCGKHKLRLRSGSNGPFWSCSGFPRCKSSFNDIDGKPDCEPKK